MNSLTAKFVLAGTKNSRAEGFFASKTPETHSSQTPPHYGAVCPSSDMVLLDEHTPPPGASVKGVGQGRH